MTPLKTAATLSAPTLAAPTLSAPTLSAPTLAAPNLSAPNLALTLAVSLAVSLVVGFSGSSVDKIAFTPSEGTTVTKTFTSSTELGIDEMSMMMDGVKPPVPPPEMTMLVTQSFTVSDKYLALGDGVPTKLARTYDSVTSDLEMEFESIGGSGAPTGVGASPLEGSTVLFTWDPDTESYDVAFAEGEDGNDELLVGLEEDLDLRRLLPEEEVAEGESYEIDISAFEDVLAAGGDLNMEMEVDGDLEGAGMDPETTTDMRRFFDELIEGSATGKYVGTRDIDGVKVAVIEIQVELNATADMSEVAKDTMGDGLPDSASMEIERMDVEMGYEGTGELHWNMAKGVIHGFTMEADLTLVTDLAVAVSFGGNVTNVVSETTVSGVVKNTVTTE